MGLFDGKKGVVFGIANDHSIAWGITEQLHAQGAVMGFTHLPDSDPARPKMEQRVRKLVEPIGAKFVLPCDATQDEHIDKVFAAARETFGTIDFVVHAMAYASASDLKGKVSDVTRDGFKQAMDISCYTLMAITKRAKPLMNKGGSILTLTYYGGEKVVPGYNVMGVCKAALESATMYLAEECGPDGIRVNALSAGPVKTLSAAGIGNIKAMMDLYDAYSPMRRCATLEEVAKSAIYLLSDLSSGVTGETLHVDGGYHVMGAPPAYLAKKSEE